MKRAKVIMLVGNKQGNTGYDAANVLTNNAHDVTARGIEEKPTIHEGFIARALERESIVSDRCELNRQINADNNLIRELKAEIK